MNVTQDKDLIAAKTRLTNAKADQAEIKLAVMRKEYVSVESVNKQWSDQAGRVRQKLLALPSRLASLISGRELAASEIESLSMELITEALAELADEVGAEE